jgi:hypothetical protein
MTRLFGSRAGGGAGREQSGGVRHQPTAEPVSGKEPDIIKKLRAQSQASVLLANPERDTDEVKPGDLIGLLPSDGAGNHAR